MLTRRQDYKGFVISWVEPRLTTEAWTVNLASDDPRLMQRIGPVAEVFKDHQSLEGAIEQARRFIDQL